jgi:HEAT repeat protein
MRRNGILILALGTLIAGATASVAQDRVVKVRIDPQGLSFPQIPPPASFPEDPADSLYRAARRSLSENDFSRAAGLFHEITTRFPRSNYAPDALYWEAFSLYRSGGASNFRTALARLQDQQTRFPRAATTGDADALTARVRGELARLGDTRAAETVAREAARAARAPRAETAPKSTVSARSRTAPVPTAAPRASAQTTSATSATPAAAAHPAAAVRGCPEAADDDTRAAALNALLQMDADQALPMIRQVLARHDACSASLREKAVFLLSQKDTPEAQNTLLSVARSDPNTEVRKTAVFWLFQVPSEQSVEILERTIEDSGDLETREAAAFALSQHASPRASQILRTVAEKGSYPTDLRGKAIFWLGQQSVAENAPYLRSLYGRLDQEELKAATLFSLARMPGKGNEAWLMSTAQNEREPVALRAKALFWAAQGGASAGQLASLYDRFSLREMREQVIFGLSQKGGSEAANKLISIARTERDPELRGKAVFWLSQSEDPRVVQVLTEIVNK